MRIRTYKPEFFTDEITGAWPCESQVLFLALLNEADDKGRFVLDPLIIRTRYFPRKPEFDFAGAFGPIVADGRVVVYEVSGKKYGWVRNFNRHQKINRPSKSRIPECPNELAEESTLSEPSVSDHGFLCDDSPTEMEMEQGEKLLEPPKEKSAAVLPLGPFLPLQQQKPKATATEARTEAAPSLCDEDYSTSLREVTPILDAWEAKFAAAIAPEPVIACFNGDRHAAESLAEAVKFADDGELDRFIAFAKGSAKPFVTKSIRSVHFFATNAGTLLADLRATEAAVRAKVGEQQPKQKQAPKEADYLEALRRGSTENSALDSVGVMRQHFAAVLESWRKDADFRASERKASAEGARVREKLQAENLERRKALDAPRVSDAGMPVAAPTAQPSRRKPLTPDQHAQRLAELAAQKGLPVQP